MTVVEVFDRLFKSDGDEQADDDGGDVNEEVSPRCLRSDVVDGRLAFDS